MTAHELFHAGKLSEAVSAAAGAVKSNPTDPARRYLLAELICFTGELDRADNQLDAIPNDSPETTAAVLAFRQLIRAEQARQDFFQSGRPPLFLTPADASERLLLEASIRLREGSPGEAVELLVQSEGLRPHPSGFLDEEEFQDFRDLDDLTASVLEVLTVKGEYYWVPLDRVEAIEFHAPERPRDLLWRSATLSVRGGPDGEVFVPTLYPGAAREDDELLRIGRQTDWRGGDGAPVRGVGQRTFLVGEESRTILELSSLNFHEPTQDGAP